MPPAKILVYRRRGKKSSDVSSNATQSAELLAHNEDLLSQILILLPVKSLMRFKHVSKLWHSFISKPQFSQSYTLSKLNGPPTGLIITPNDRGAQIRNFLSLGDTDVSDKSVHSLKFLNVPANYIRILDTCNGLTLCRCGSRSRTYKYDPNVTYYVCNLATKQYKALPSLRRPAKSSQFFALSFDPFVSPHYKVCVGNVCVTKQGDLEYEFRVFSSETGAWRPAMRRTAPLQVSVMERLCTSWNGWIICGYSYLDESCWYLDINNECMSSLDLPSPNPDYSNNLGLMRRIKPNLQVCNSRLFLVDWGEILTTHINIYEMERGTGWTLKYEVDYYRLAAPHFGIHLNPRISSLEVISVVGGRRDDDPLLIVKVPGKLSCYNLKDEKSKVILRRCALLLSSGQDVYGHFETLAQP